MAAPVVKKRTRIKINLPLSPENLDLNRDAIAGSNCDKLFENSNEENLDSISDATEKIRNIINAVEAEVMEEEILEVPRPAPRKIRKPLKTIDEPAENEQNEKETELQSNNEPIEVESSENVADVEPAETVEINSKIEEPKEFKSTPKKQSPKLTELKKIGKKKKRKAADVIASVLRKESKQFPKVATILQESEEKDKDEGDVGSPWDTPPHPKSLEKVYIQHKYGFSVRDWCDFYSKPDVTKEDVGNRFAVDVALSFHGLWSRLSIFSHGLVAGIAGCHALAVAAALAVTQGDVPQFVSFYYFLSLKIHFLIYVFTTLCVISCFDRLDIGQSRGHLKSVGRSHGTLLVTFTYLLCLGLSLAAHRHTAAIEAYSADNTLWDAQGLQEWTSLVTIRDILLLLSWIFMSCSTPSDFLQEKLLAMTNRQKSGKATLWKLPEP